MTPLQASQRSIPSTGQGRDRFVHVLRAEYTKFRTVRGWVIAVAAAPLMIVLVALLAGISSVQQGKPSVPISPGGEPVTDSFYFVHQTLAGNGSITVAVSELTEHVSADQGSSTVPWAKAGLIINQGTNSQGSPYAAIMATAGHGVRFQDDYVNDIAGLPGPVSTASVRWLRLERSGEAVTGYDSIDGAHWSAVGAVRLDGLGSRVQVGLFVASPPVVHGAASAASAATAAFGDLRLDGSRLDGAWTGQQVGAQSPSFSGYPRGTTGAFTQAGESFTVTGAGDIAPAVHATLPGGGTIDTILAGAFAALITLIVIGTLFITAEYQNAMIRLTLSASPRRGRVLMAKAIVLGTVTFATTFAGAAIAVPLGEHLARANGVYLFPVTASTRLRVEIGTAALLATTAILALAVGTIFRRSTAAVATVVAAIVLPYVLVVQNPFMPAAASNWLARVTPVAAFAVQQTLTRYHQVTGNYTPYDGYYPLSAWAGYAVLAGYTAASLAIAAILLRRRDV